MDARLELVYQALRKVPVMLVVVRVVDDSVLCFPGFALFLDVIKYTFGFAREVGELLTYLDERVVLLLNLVQE